MHCLFNRDEGDTGDKSRRWAYEKYHNLTPPLPGQPSARVPSSEFQVPSKVIASHA